MSKVFDTSAIPKRDALVTMILLQFSVYDERKQNLSKKILIFQVPNLPNNLRSIEGFKMADFSDFYYDS